MSSFEDVDKVAFVNESAKCLADNFLPGPLTLVLKKRKNVPNVVTGGLDKIAVRIPNNEVALDLLLNFGPLTVTSANVHSMEAPHHVKDIQIQLGDSVAVYLEHGKLEGSPSTIVDMTAKKPNIVREGAITKREILDMI